MPNPVIQISNAVRHLADKHGLPNRFAAHEVALASGVNQMLVGRYLSGNGGVDQLAEAARRSIDELLAEMGIRVQAYGPEDDGYSWLDVCEYD